MTVRVQKESINLREEISRLNKPSGIKGEELLRAETAADAQALLGVGRKNLIINGDCRISQRGDFTAVTNAADETYYIDRFQTNFLGVTAQKNHTLNPTDPPPEMPGDCGLMKIRASSSASGFMGYRQTIEDYKAFDGRAFTVSVYVRHTAPEIRFYLYNGSNTAWGKKTVPNDGQWHRLEETFYFDYSAGSKAAIEILTIQDGGAAVSLTSGDYVEFTGFQVELGTVATPFEHRSYGEELALCQRYYQKSYLSTVSPGTASGVGAIDTTISADPANVITNVQFKGRMRAAPTVTIYAVTTGASGALNMTSSGGGATVATPTVDNVSESACRVYAPLSGSAWAGHRIYFQYVAISEL